MVFIPVCRQMTGELGPLRFRHVGQILRLKRRACVVPGDAVDRLAIGRQTQGVRAVFASSSEDMQLGHLVELVIAVRVAATIKAAPDPSIDRDVKGVKGIEHPLCPGDRHRQAFHLHRIGAARSGQGDPAQAFRLLITGNQAAFVVESDTDPGAKLIFGDGEQPLHLKAGQRIKNAGRDRGLVEHVSPRGVAEFGKELGLHPFRGVGLLRHQPRFVGDESLDRAIGAVECQSSDEPSHGVEVLDLGQQGVLPLDHILGDVDQ